MAFESYAERQRRQQRSGQPEIYVYDKAPAQLRHQIKVALSEGIGTYNLTDPSGFNDYAPDDTVAYDCWKEIDRACRKEVFPYLKYVDDHDHFTNRVSAAIAGIVEIDEWISVVDICCKIMSTLIDKHHVHVNEAYPVVPGSSICSGCTGLMGWFGSAPSAGGAPSCRIPVAVLRRRGLRLIVWTPFRGLSRLTMSQ